MRRGCFLCASARPARLFHREWSIPAGEGIVARNMHEHVEIREGHPISRQRRVWLFPSAGLERLTGSTWPVVKTGQTGFQNGCGVSAANEGAGGGRL